MDNFETFYGGSACSFAVAKGIGFGFQKGCLAVDKGSHAASLARFQPCAKRMVDDMAGTRHLLLPAIPALDVVVVGPGVPLPDFVAAPLQKIPTSGAAQHAGVASGRRSALYRDTTTGTVYKLKGCGDGPDGFPTRGVEKGRSKMTPGGVACEELRGCMFRHTALRELYMISVVNDVMARAIPSYHPAMEGVGWWDYHQEEPYPDIIRCCAIYRVHGERRLCDHLLQGLEMILSEIDLPQKLPEGANASVTWIKLLCGDAMFNLLDVLDTLPECLQVFATLYFRLGKESGEILRATRAAGISWGTYEDPLGYHCNAHPNNLVVLNPTASAASGRLVAPVDYDMAFAVEDWVLEKSPEEFIALEDAALPHGLAGNAEICMPTLQVVAMGEGSAHDSWRWLLRDTMLCGFNTTTIEGGGAQPTRDTPTEHHALIAQALLRTKNVIS